MQARTDRDMRAVEAERLGVIGARRPILDSISFRVAAGQSLAVFGGAAAGKTALLQALAGRLPAHDGRIRIHGRQPSRRGRRVAMVSQEPDVVGLFTPHQLIGRRMAVCRVPGALRPARMAEALAVCGLYEQRDRPCRELSRSQQAAVSLASALALHPAVLLLDNVTAALPEPLAAAVWAHLAKRRSEDGLILVFATTRSEEAEQADLALLLERGRALALEPPETLLARHAPDRLVIEADDPAAVQRTLRGAFDVEVLETGEGLVFRALDGTAAAADAFRHGGVRTVYQRRATLWDALDTLRAAGHPLA